MSAIKKALLKSGGSPANFLIHKHKEDQKNKTSGKASGDTGKSKRK